MVVTRFSNTFPRYKEVEDALMCLLYFRGGCLVSGDTYEPLADYFNLTTYARHLSRDEYFGDYSKQSAWENRVQYGRRRLKDLGYLDPNAGRAVWKLTKKGKRQAATISEKHIKLWLSDYVDTPTLKAMDLIYSKEMEETVRKQYSEYRILRDTKIARKVKELHKYRCQLCGQAIQLGNGRLYAEAHHIQHLGSPHCGPDIPSNIICVCPNHHVRLDYGAIRLEVPQLRTCPEHVVEDRYIQYHNANIYGEVRQL